ncbi:hypothetical protein D9Q98_004045 [Chlorella vulgaris]|uniref:Uncharacterized protein n=1 Tax=Chlorella vulgaris TaxID=3077 RepID=A0A9D4TRJ3_CHLVU|nr:hypothetical protein D9Q98_004045 [Chlorella vulgaris]
MSMIRAFITSGTGLAVARIREAVFLDDPLSDALAITAVYLTTVGGAKLLSSCYECSDVAQVMHRTYWRGAYLLGHGAAHGKVVSWLVFMVTPLAVLGRWTEFALASVPLACVVIRKCV